MNPPELLLFASFDGVWSAYEVELNRIFTTDIAQGNIQYGGLGVSCRRNPETAGRWAAFWHLVQEGHVEDDRLPDMRRCERIRWIRWVIENATDHPEIDIWNNKRKSEVNELLWFREEYLVILGKRNGYWLLRSAYCTEQSRRIAQLRKERDSFQTSKP